MAPIVRRTAGTPRIHLVLCLAQQMPSEAVVARLAAGHHRGPRVPSNTQWAEDGPPHRQGIGCARHSRYLPRRAHASGDRPLTCFARCKSSSRSQHPRWAKPQLGRRTESGNPAGCCGLSHRAVMGLHTTKPVSAPELLRAHRTRSDVLGRGFWRANALAVAVWHYTTTPSVCVRSGGRGIRRSDPAPEPQAP